MNVDGGSAGWGTPAAAAVAGELPCKGVTAGPIQPLNDPARLPLVTGEKIQYRLGGKVDIR